MFFAGMLGSIKDEDVSGINVVWSLCGTPGSIFAWHIEDRILAALNVLVAGAPKEWYVVKKDDYWRICEC